VVRVRVRVSIGVEARVRARARARVMVRCRRSCARRSWRDHVRVGVGVRRDDIDVDGEGGLGRYMEI